MSGLPAHKPTPEKRAQVEALAACGVPHVEIGKFLGLDPKTLRKHYRDEIDNANMRCIAAVAGSLYQQAISGNTAAMIFWMKARAGWREKSEVEHTLPPQIALRFLKE